MLHNKNPHSRRRGTRGSDLRIGRILRPASRPHFLPTARLAVPAALALGLLLALPGVISDHSALAANQARTPAPQALGVPADAAVEIVLDADQVWSAKTPPAIQLHGRQSGPHSVRASYAARSRTLSLVPDRPFLPGEMARLAIARQEGFAGALLTFHVAAAPGPARFARMTGFEVSKSPNMLAAADLDADGDLDLVVTAVLGVEDLHVFINQGDGAFSPLPAMALDDIEDPSRFVLADLDRDSRLDLVIPGETSGNLAVLRGRGDGRFVLDATRKLETGTPVQAITGDLNLDGRDEVLIAHLSSTDRITVLPAESGGNLGRERRVRAARGIESVALADLDGDQDLDLAAANEEGDQVILLRNLGDGRFEQAGTLETGSRPEVVMAADLNGDRVPDLITVNQGSNEVSVFLAGPRAADPAGNESGPPRSKRDTTAKAIAYRNPIAYATGDRPFLPALADLDGDGDLDLAVPGLDSDDVTVLLNEGSGIFSLGTRFAVDAGPVAVEAADFDGDGVIDLAVASSIADHVTVWRNTLAEYPPAPTGQVTKERTPRDLAQNVPNPFNPATEISYKIEKPGPVTLVVFNSSGKIVRTLVHEFKSAGEHLVAWDGLNDAGDKLPSGTYFYRLTTRDSVELRRMTLLR